MWRACYEAGKKRDVVIIGEPNAIEHFQDTNEMDYKGFMEKLYSGRLDFHLEPVEKEFQYFQLQR